MFQTFKLKIPVFTVEMNILNNFTLSKWKHTRSEIGPPSMSQPFEHKIPVFTLEMNILNNFIVKMKAY